ncbi:unnamed protein product [Fraxinus pennsylvanica]|uniref:Reverse transcriptase zinc-binding domain-containing protein n=1 Tax=Fraxinus pennsylvanica TaxID=56036 RepID=A0AAD2DT01_9LAMI|nr:unnamed protein product [Fraxinus pennsylvanica]
MCETKAAEVVQTIGARKEGSDMVIWKPNDNGDFSTSSAWDIVRVRSPKIPWMKWIWHKFLPKKVSFCMWKVKFNCLSVDSRVRSTGVALVSRCDCCDKGQVETLDHVLNSGDIAKVVWKWASLALGVHYFEAQSWWIRVNRWFTCAKNVSQRGILIGLLPSLITGKLWGCRCKARMEGNREFAEEVWLAIKAWLRLLAEEIVKVSKLSKTVMNFSKLQSCLWVLRGGGVTRDHYDNLVAGFCVKYGYGSNNETKLRAVIIGVELCKELGFQRVEIECDSTVVVNWFTPFT